MANVPLVANPLLPPVPDEPKDLPAKYQPLADQVWQWMKDLTLQMKILFGSPQASNSQITIPLVQAGTVLAFAGLSANIPTGYLMCDGSQVSQTQYSALFSAIGTQWNTGGEGAGNFRLPDFRGRTLAGAGTGTGLSPRTVGQILGEENHTLATAEIPAVNVNDPGHIHGITDPEHSHTQGFWIAGAGVGGIWAMFPNEATSTRSGTQSGGIDAAATGITIKSGLTGITVGGGGGAHNNMQPTGIVIWIIKF